MATTFIVELSTGDVLETEDEAVFVGWLDEHGPEVVSSHRCPDGSRALADAIIADKSVVDAIIAAKNHRTAWGTSGHETLSRADRGKFWG